MGFPGWLAARVGDRIRLHRVRPGRCVLGAPAGARSRAGRLAPDLTVSPRDRYGFEPGACRAMGVFERLALRKGAQGGSRAGAVRASPGAPPRVRSPSVRRTAATVWHAGCSLPLRKERQIVKTILRLGFRAAVALAWMIAFVYTVHTVVEVRNARPEFRSPVAARSPRT